MKKFFIALSILSLLSVTAYSDVPVYSKAEWKEICLHEAEENWTSREVIGLHPAWLHHVAAVRENGNLVELENGYTFKIGLFWSGRSKGWEQGDIVTISFDFTSFFYKYRLKNVIKDEIVWGSEPTLSNTNAPEKRYIISTEDHFTTVVLNDGLKLHSDVLGYFRIDRAGDIVIPCSVLYRENPYCLLNTMNNTIGMDLTIVED